MDIATTTDQPNTAKLIQDLFAATAALKAAFPDRHFTPDGHMIGSIGEVLAAERYGLTLTTASTKGVDAHDSAGRSVEIKATSGNRGVALRGMTPTAELFIALKINEDGTAEEIYHGLAAPVWAAIAHKKMADNGQRTISLKCLQGLMEDRVRVPG